MAYLGFSEGARAKDARFEAPEAPMEWSVGRECPLPTEEGVWGGSCAPPQKLKKNFFGSMCSKNFRVQAKGGGASPSAPPKYATAYTCLCTVSLNTFHISYYYVFTFLTR